MGTAQIVALRPDVIFDTVNDSIIHMGEQNAENRPDKQL